MRAVVTAGVLSGLLGGALMAIVAMRLSLVSATGGVSLSRHIAAAVIGTDALDGGLDAFAVGLAVHLATSIAWGVVFAALAGRALRGAAALGVALLSSVVIYAIMTFGVLPTVNPFLYSAAMHDFGTWFVAHLAYGVGLAVAPALRARALRGSDRNAHAGGNGRDAAARPLRESTA